MHSRLISTFTALASCSNLHKADVQQMHHASVLPPNHHSCCCLSSMVKTHASAKYKRMIIPPWFFSRNTMAIPFPPHIIHPLASISCTLSCIVTYRQHFTLVAHECYTASQPTTLQDLIKNKNVIPNSHTFPAILTYCPPCPRQKTTQTMTTFLGICTWSLWTFLKTSTAPGLPLHHRPQSCRKSLTSFGVCMGP